MSFTQHSTCWRVQILVEKSTYGLNREMSLAFENKYGFKRYGKERKNEKKKFKKKIPVPVCGCSSHHIFMESLFCRASFSFLGSVSYLRFCFFVSLFFYEQPVVSIQFNQATLQKLNVICNVIRCK